MCSFEHNDASRSLPPFLMHGYEYCRGFVYASSYRHDWEAKTAFSVLFNRKVAENELILRPSAGYFHHAMHCNIRILVENSLGTS
jgi:hypothetical protein